MRRLLKPSRFPHTRKQRPPREPKRGPVVSRCKFHFALEFPEGLSASDFKKVAKLLDFLGYSLRGIGQLPGIETAFPANGKRGSHIHPARLFMDNFLEQARTFAEKRRTAEQLTLSLEAGE